MAESIVYAKASIQFLMARASVRSEECQTAMRDCGGDLLAAWKHLNPTAEIRKFHDLYTFGPFLRVSDPEQDLPCCEPSSMYTFRCADSKNDRGDRSIAPFGDANSLSDILGTIYVTESYPQHWDDRQRFQVPTVQGRLMEISDRILQKLVRNKSAERGRLFGDALERVERAKDAYFDRDFAIGSKLLFEVEKLLQEGNRAR